MNINRLFYFPVVALLLLLMACSGDLAFEGKEAPQPTGGEFDDDLVPVTFTVGEKVDFTRAATNIVTFDNNEDIKVFVKPAGADGYSPYTYTTAVAGQTNVTLTAPATPPYFPPGTGSTVQAYAYYPATAVSGAVFSVAADQTLPAGYKASDLMFAANRTIPKGSAEGTNLAMAHLMAQLHLNVTAVGLTVSSVKVNAKRSVNFSVSDAGVPSTSLTDDASSDITAATAAGDAYVCIPPQQISIISIKVMAAGEGDEAARTATFTFTSNSNFVAGNTYPINLTVSAAQLGLTTAVADWNGMNPVTIAPTGDMTIDDIASVTYTGSAHTPSVTVRKNGTEVTSSNYDLTWINNTNAGTAVVVATGKNTYAGSVAVGTFTINKAAGSISYASATETKTYGNTAFTKTLTKTGDGMVTYSCSSAGVATVNGSGQVTIVGAGSTSVTATVADGTNYTYATNTAYYDLTVNQAALTLTADDKSRIYGTTNPALTYTASGFVNGETTSVLTTQPTLSTTANVSSAVGTYPITISGAAAANYTISYVNGTLTVISPYTAMSSASASDVGKLICTSGHIHAYGADAGCTADRVAVIAYVGSAGSVETGQSGYKGLALALVDCNKDNCSYWSGSNAYEPWCSQSSSYCTSDYTTAIATAVTKKNGLSMTTTLLGHASHTHHAAKSASGYNASRPSGASAWFLPSMGQWNLICQGLATKKAGSSVTTNLTTSSNSTYQASNLNSVITGAGGTGFQSSLYWSSTEYSTNGAWYMLFNDGRAGYGGKTRDGYVRAVFAF